MIWDWIFGNIFTRFALHEYQFPVGFQTSRHKVAMVTEITIPWQPSSYNLIIPWSYLSLAILFISLYCLTQCIELLTRLSNLWATYKAAKPTINDSLTRLTHSVHSCTGEHTSTLSDGVMTWYWVSWWSSDVLLSLMMETWRIIESHDGVVTCYWVSWWSSDELLSLMME